MKLIFFFNLDISETLGEINLDGFPSIESLHLRLKSSNCLSIRNLPSLRHLSLDFASRIDSSILSQLFENLPTIEYLTLNGILSNINLDSLINLKSLHLNGIVDKYFNFSLFENICNRLEILSIELNQFKDLYRMFEGHEFSNLNTLYI